MLRLHQPTDAELAALAAEATGKPFTYEAVGATRGPEWPSGHRHDRFSAEVGDAAWFPLAVERLRRWQPQLGAGIAVAATDEVAEGATVAMAARLPLGWVLATCRVIYVEEGDASFAWAYGTLPLHPESGEERFEVAIEGDRTVFRIGVFSRPHGWLSRSARPIARTLQGRATTAYIEAMREPAR